MSDPAPPNLAGQRNRERVILTLVVGLAAVLRFWNIDHRSFWLDEYLTISLSSGKGMTQYDLPSDTWFDESINFIDLQHAAPWWRVWTNSGGDVHPPLFYLLLRMWRVIGGDSEAWIRTLSTLFSLTAIVLLYVAIRAQGWGVGALWACAIMALAGAQIDYAQECRSYALLEMCLLGAVAALLRIEHFGFTAARMTALAVCCAGAALTHYVAIPGLGVIGLYALVRLSGRDRTRVLIGLAIAGIICAALWVPFALVQARGFLGKISYTETSAWSGMFWLSTIARLPARLLVLAPALPAGWFWLGLPFYVLPIFLFRRNRSLVFWWMWLTLGALALAGGDLVRQARTLEYPRFTLTLGPGVFALAGLTFAHLSGWRKHLLPAAIALACAVAIPGAYGRAKGDWRQLGQYVAAHLGAEDVLVLQEDLTDGWRARCDLIGLQLYVRPLRVPVIILGSPPPPQAADRIDQARAVWLFRSFALVEPQEIFPGRPHTVVVDLSRVGRLSRIESEPTSTPQAP